MEKRSYPGKLTALKVSKAKPKEKPYKLFDGGGLFLLVQTNGARYWRYKYRFAGKEKLLSIGVFPSVSLASAREIFAEARTQLSQGVDPGRAKKDLKRDRLLNNFLSIGMEWHERKSCEWSEKHASRVLADLQRDVFPPIGDIPIKLVSVEDVLSILRTIEGREALDVAKRTKQRISDIFRYAIRTGRADRNPTDTLHGVIKTRKVVHRAALPANQIPEFMAQLEVYKGDELTKLALKLIILTFVRPGELRHARWEEFDYEKAIWKIPGERMKMKEEHIVPLSSQAIEVLKEIRRLSRGSDLLFPGKRTMGAVMSENTLTYAIRKRLGFNATAHGFRATASTVLNESGFNPDVIERQLAHASRDKVRAAYNRSQYLADRIKMMQWWADYVGNPSIASNVVQFVSKSIS
ncbi:MAG: tyrosine-type recombinase/integrase [Gammaproteobacteria bacterium]|nr:tyrosine-type recombinase/integrase [Gammaproteobacteria bacterium]MDH5692893.1 tyrosine-type recombinase/integrase [Gammaproteobacteria bacterium]